jgi:hypothetical protein
MNDYVPAIALALLALAVLVITWVIRSARERKAARAREAAALGFRPMAPADPDVVGRIAALHRRSPGHALDVRELWCQERGFQTLYLFDLVDRSAQDAGPTAERAIAVVSAALHLPRFSLLPRIEGEGMLGALGNLLLERFATPAGEPLAFPSSPAFERRYTLAAADEQAARRFFTAERLAGLGETRFWMVEGENDTLTLHTLDLDLARGRRKAPDLAERLRAAERAAALFADAPV